MMHMHIVNITMNCEQSYWISIRNIQKKTKDNLLDSFLMSSAPFRYAYMQFKLPSLQKKLFKIKSKLYFMKPTYCLNTAYWDPKFSISVEKSILPNKFTIEWREFIIKCNKMKHASNEIQYDSTSKIIITNNC